MVVEQKAVQAGGSNADVAEGLGHGDGSVWALWWRVPAFACGWLGRGPRQHYGMVMSAAAWAYIWGQH